jgi:hypothetical protein
MNDNKITNIDCVVLELVSVVQLLQVLRDGAGTVGETGKGHQLLGQTSLFGMSASVALSNCVVVGHG